MRPIALLADDRWQHDGGPSWFWGPVVLLLFFGFVAVMTWLLLRRVRPGRSTPLDRGREILAERFARGELTVEEYRERMEELR